MADFIEGKIEAKDLDKSVKSSKIESSEDDEEPYYPQEMDKLSDDLMKKYD